MKDTILDAITHTVLQRVGEGFPEIIAERVSSIFAKMVKCDRCGDIAPEVRRSQGTIAFASYTPVRMGGGYSAVLCRECSNTWNKMYHRSHAGLTPENPWMAIQKAFAEKTVFEYTLVGINPEALQSEITSRLIDLDQAVHKAELELFAFSQAWVVADVEGDLDA